MKSAMAYLKRIVRIRKKLIRDKNSRKDFLQVCAAIKPIDAWLQAYPNANEQAAIRFIRLHYYDVLTIIPGKDCSLHTKLMKQLQDILSSNQISLQI